MSIAGLYRKFQRAQAVLREHGWYEFSYRCRVSICRAVEAMPLCQTLRFRKINAHSGLVSWQLPSHFPVISSMVSPPEQRFLYWYARQQYSGRGGLVELGCWLGSSTVPLVLGLVQNKHLESSMRRVYVYDHFVWTAGMNKAVVGTELENRYQTGDNFEEAYRKTIEPWRELVAVHATNLVKCRWTGQPIEFLFVDAMKSAALCEAICKQFFPWLIPGLSLVMHQDFCHFYTPWIHVIMYRLRDYLVPVGSVETSALFKCVKPIPCEVLLTAEECMTVGPDELDACFAYSCSLVDWYSRPAVMSAKVMFHLHRGDHESARNELDKLRCKVKHRSKDIEEVEKLMGIRN